MIAMIACMGVWSIYAPNIRDTAIVSVPGPLASAVVRPSCERYEPCVAALSHASTPAYVNDDLAVVLTPRLDASRGWGANPFSAHTVW